MLPLLLPPAQTQTPVPAPLPNPLPDGTREALLEALADGRKAEATYAGVLARFGPVEPFLSVVEAERRDQAALLELLRAHTIEVPETPLKTEPPRIPAATLPEACAEGVKLEEASIALYERLLSKVREPDVREVFRRIQTASRDHHLPAFRRCANP